MISMQIKVDLDAFTKGMDDLQQRQIPFATSLALNNVAKDVQVAERIRLREVFTIRRPQWADYGIKIDHFASKAEPFARIAINPPGGKKGDIFGKFEDQTQKTPLGSHGIAVPVDAKRTKADIVQDKTRPKNLHLHREGNRIVGDNGTYIVNLSDGRQLLLQRKDLGKRAAKKAGRGTNDRATLLFIFVPKVRITPTLRFAATAEPVVDRQWPVRWAEAFDKAMGSAR
jgi:hypothetical protein